MSVKVPCLFLVALAIIIAVPAAADDTDGDADGSWYYIYGDNPVFDFLDPRGDVSWEVTGSATAGGIMEDVPFDPLNGGRSIHVNLKGYEVLRVEQTVTFQGTVTTDVWNVVPLHMPAHTDEGRYEAVFWDGSVRSSTYVVTGEAIVGFGEDHVRVPAAPAKVGYTFEGWYTDRQYTQPFDPKQPLYGDVDVYAKWSGSGLGSGSGGSHTVVIRDTYVVTFQQVNGLRYDILSSGSDSVRFTVSAVDGFVFDMSSVRVNASAGTLNREADGTYVLSNIRSDVLVSIQGDRVFSVDYRLDRATVSVDGHDSPPPATVQGQFVAYLGTVFGWSGLRVTVLMDGADVTSRYVEGSTVNIGEVTGNLVIIAESSLPWLYIAVIAIIAVAAVIAYVWYRKRERRS